MTFNLWLEEQVSRMIWSFRDAVVREMWHEVSGISTVVVSVTTVLQTVIRSTKVLFCHCLMPFFFLVLTDTAA